MILHSVLSELDAVLAESGALMGLYKAKDMAFFTKSQTWLEKLETLATANRWPLQASIAGLRGQLVTASRIQREDSFNWMPKSKNSRRVREALAAECIKAAIELTENFVAQDRAKHAEAVNLLRQIVAVAIFKGIVEPKPTNGRRQSISESWSAVASDPELASASVNVVGLVGAYNTFMLFDKSFNEVLIDG